jgi:hypothetical protein
MNEIKRHHVLQLVEENRITGLEGVQRNFHASIVLKNSSVAIITYHTH